MCKAELFVGMLVPFSFLVHNSSGTAKLGWGDEVSISSSSEDEILLAMTALRQNDSS